MATKKRMGGMSLSSFAKTPADTVEPTVTPTDKPKASVTEKAKAKRKTIKQEPYANLNIQITRSQQRWLQDTAQQVRDNNAEPVPAKERVYPVHLIQLAIDLLKAQSINWDEVKTTEELRDSLNI